MINQFRRSIRRSFRRRNRQSSTSNTRIGNELSKEQTGTLDANQVPESPSIPRQFSSSENNNNNVPASTTVTSLSRFQDDTPIDPNKSPEWQEDERNVRQGQCHFKIKFVGYIEVKDPRGMPVCEDAVKELNLMKKNKKKYGSSSVDPNNVPQRGIIARLSFRKRSNSRSRSNTNASSSNNNADPHAINIEGDLITGPSSDKWPNGRKHKIVSKKAVLWISPDSLRVVEDKKKTLLVDQTIEKVSFCAPDRHFPKSFSYICRDGTTRKWWCYTFNARKNVSGERLSHAVGCAFTACLKRKLDLEKHAKVATVEAQERQEAGGEEGVSNLIARSATEPVINVVDKRLQKNASMVNEKHEEERAERTKQLVDEKHPELRKSMRSRPKSKPSITSAGSNLPTPSSALPPNINKSMSSPVTSGPPAPLLPPQKSHSHSTHSNGFDPLQPQKTIDELLAQNPTPTPSTEIAAKQASSPANWNPWESNANDNQNQTDSGYHNGFQQPTQQQQQQQQPQSSYPILQPTLQSPPVLSSNNPFLQDHLNNQKPTTTPADQWLNEITQTTTPSDNTLLLI